MLQIILDTETTGLNPDEGHRIIEIGCVELRNRQPTGRTFHHYINPGRNVESGALAVHGITNAFLSDKPSFGDIFDAFIEFVKDAEIVAHNAPFDMGFIINEIKLLAKSPKIFTDNVTVFDTLVLARKMFPGQRNSLDALCKRLKIDISERNLHGALLDANLLTKVYLRLTGGQTSLFGDFESSKNLFTKDSKFDKSLEASINIASIKNKNRKPLPIIRANQDELLAHEKFMEKIKKASD